MRTTYITAIAIAVALALWLYSGTLGEPEFEGHPTLAEANRTNAAAMEDRPAARVRARRINAVPRTKSLTIRGRTANKRTVTARSETTGRIVARPVERGTPVRAGDLLCKLSVEDRQAALVEAREALNQARIEYQGSLQLKERGFQSDTAIATTKARMAAAEADVHRSELALERTAVRAPFAGLVEETHVELGDYVTPGTGCATIVDLNPMLMAGRVPEKDVHHVELNQHASGRIADGRVLDGVITFVGSQSDDSTRTYPVEIQIDNADYSVRSGISAEISIPLSTVLAHQISPALLALDDEGRIGVRIVDSDNRVQFQVVEIVAEETGSIWVSGLPAATTLITVGQEMVVPGEAVDVTFEPTGEMPASAPPAPVRKSQDEAGATPLDDNQTPVAAL